VRYELPLSSAQELALKFFAELFGALAPPLGVLFFLDFTDKSKRRLKAISLWVLVLLEVGVISVIGFLAWAERTTQSTETLLSSIVVLAGLAASVVVATNLGTLDTG
jgi:quinol-cytochrome oxidoreductase complex cytochrome b subunit